MIPAYNEAESLPTLLDEVCQALDPLELSYEVLVVDDGSSDDSPTLLTQLQTSHPSLRPILHRRNRGKSAAYMSGFDAARGARVITLDADLQDDPSEIPHLLDTLDRDWDLVVGWKQGRLHNEPLKAIPSRLYNGLKGYLFGLRLHDSNCGFRVLRRDLARDLNLYGGHYRFLPELAHHRGFRVTEHPVHHRARRFGHSKYGPRRFWTGILDLFALRFLLSFRHRPLQFFGTLAALPASLGLALELYVLVCKLRGDTFATHLAALIVGVLCLMVGTQLFSVGLLGEMLRSLHPTRPAPTRLP